MRVAIFVLSLLAMAGSEAGQAQALEATDSPALGAALSTLAMNNSNRMLADLAVPRFNDSAARNGVGAHRVPLATPRLRTFNRSSVRDAVRPVTVSHATTSPLANLPHAPMAGRGAALIQPLGGQRVIGQPARSTSDHVLTGVVALMLIAYQLRRKHRVLRPHPFAR